MSKNSPNMHRENWAIIIQARLGSSRLPGKILMPLWNEKSILEIILDSIKSLDLPIFIATSKNPENIRLKEIANKYDVGFYAGEEEDVLSRFVKIIKNRRLTHVIRICADNPFLNMDYLNELIFKTMEDTSADYWSFSFSGMPTILTHFGIFAEIVKAEALVRSYDSTKEPIYLEHVTNYVHRHPELFQLALYELPNEFKKYQNVRLTVDTKEDFETAKIILENLGVGAKDEMIFKFLDQRPELLEQMAIEIKKNTK